MISLPEYATIKDYYCLAHWGHNKEYLLQMCFLRPYMEASFPEIKIFISCRDEHMYLLNGQERILQKSKVIENKNQFAYIREICNNQQTHPVEDFMNESEIYFSKIANQNSKYSVPGSCVLLTQSNQPTKQLTSYQLQKITEHVEKFHIDIQINKPPESFDWIIGVENELLYDQAAKGKKVTLIPTGVGENLFKNMFPDAEILKISQHA
jgi:hypothetical protein